MKLLKKLVPASIFNIIYRLILIKQILRIYFYDFLRFCKYSPVLSGYNNKLKLEAKIIERYHSLEKGLTMPEFRFNFGVPTLLSLADNCIEFYEKYGMSTQVKHALSVIFEYEKRHNDSRIALPSEVKMAFQNIRLKITFDQENFVEQEVITRSEYFSEVNSDFLSFAKSRSSLRNFLEDQVVDIDLLRKALDIAISAPSACNRQSVRTYVYSDKEQIKDILEVQGGNRGFGHLTDKLIIITSDLSVWGQIRERNQAFIDGGIFAMNLLYGLHFYGIGACILNCSLSRINDKKLRSLSSVRDSESFIAMISCGVLPEQFMKATSKRYNVSEILTIIN